jgi:16S rRNA G527 N7-methylase RsmG
VERERDEARECLLEAMKHADNALREDDALSRDTEHYPYHKHYWPMVQRWMKAAGIYHIRDAKKMVEDHIVDANKMVEDEQ